MSFIQDFENLFVTTEQDVINIIAQIKADVQVAEADLTAALNWVAKNEPAIVADLQMAEGLAQAVGIVSPATLLAANAAVAALTAIANAQNAANAAGTTGLVVDAKTVIAGFTAVQQSRATVATAKATAAQTTATTTPAAPTAS